METQWHTELPIAITVCDKDGKVIYMNEKSIETFAKYGGSEIIGNNLSDCHPEPAKSILQGMLKNPVLNAYTIEKNGIKKLIYQSPWYKNGEYRGYIELSLVIPFEMKNFIRKA